MSDQGWVVRDASGEYLRDEAGEERTPASDEAYEFDSREAAEAACDRATDKVFVRDVE